MPLPIVFVTPMHAISAPGGRPNSAVSHEMTRDTADDRTFDTTTRPCLGWNGESDGRKTAQHYNDQRFFHEFLRVRSHVTVEVAIGSYRPHGFLFAVLRFRAMGAPSRAETGNRETTEQTKQSLQG